MLLRRITQHVKAQNWTAIAIDFVIVVVGVFIGLQVSNWNNTRAAHAETKRTLDQVAAFIDVYDRNTVAFRTYYETTQTYGKTALKGWADKDSVTDKDFLVAAYQASQITQSTGNTMVHAEILGAENIRNIRNADLQRRLQFFVATPPNTSRIEAVNTPYRETVRRAIPFQIQENIRRDCGDTRLANGSLYLPPQCDIELNTAEAQAAAQDLRKRVDLRDDLKWHMSSVTSLMFDLQTEAERNKALQVGIRAYLN